MAALNLKRKAITRRLEEVPVVYSCCMVTGNINECRRIERGLYLNEQDRYYGFQVRAPRCPVRPDAVWVW